MTKEVIQKCLDWMQGTENFVIDQAPDLCKEILNYGKVVNSIWFIIGVVMLVCGIFLWKKNFSKVDWNGEMNIHGFYCLSGGASIALSLLVTLITGFTLCKIFTAPKLYLIEQLSHVLKNIT